MESCVESVNATTLSDFAPGKFTLGGDCSWQATTVSPNSTKFFRVPSIESGEHLHRCLIHGQKKIVTTPQVPGLS
jgi:hypothetical protein